jgi:hypothetical protein
VNVSSNPQFLRSWSSYTRSGSGGSWKIVRREIGRMLGAALADSGRNDAIALRREKTSPVSVDTYGLGGFLLHLLLFQVQLLVVVR